MKASVEISMYPLQEHYGTPILEFIQGIKQHADLDVRTNTMSTQIFGEYDRIMTALQEEIKVTFQKHGKTVMVLKIANIDLKP